MIAQDDRLPVADIGKEPELSAFYEEEIAWEMARITMIDSQLPSKKTRRAPGFDLRQWRAEKRRL